MNSVKMKPPTKRQMGEVLLLLIRIRPAQDRVVDDGILHVDDHAGGGIDGAQLLDGENALEEAAGQVGQPFA